ncbi:MAG: FAD/NAD(P)-binding oxidoreductase [Flavobacterium sp.]|nr:FAD/NAD(P)-binding oxidoreductase [Flavobacterium sp.]
MSSHYQIVIIGGGNAGLSVASQLLRKRSNLDIAIIEPSEKHYYQPAWTLVGAGVYDINKTVKKEKDFIPKGTTWIKEAVTKFEPQLNTVVCTNGKKISYDFLIVCPGIQLDWGKIKGLKETLGKNNVSSNYSFEFAPKTWEFIKNFEGGTAIFTNPKGAIKCGGAPHKVMYLAVDYWRKKGILDKCDVHYLSGGSIIFGIKEYAKTLDEVVKRGNIKTHFKVDVTEIDGDKKIAFYEQENSNGAVERKSIPFDLCHAVPPQSAPDFIKESPLTNLTIPLGYVDVDKYTMQHNKFSNVFSLGDSSSAPCGKSGAAIRKQAPVVVANILSILDNKQPTAKYDGYAACPIPTQYGKLMLAEFDYSNTPKMSFPIDQAKPRWSMWILKTKVLPWLYWNKILKGTA